jgi:probable rRNA maturation factor
MKAPEKGKKSMDITFVNRTNDTVFPKYRAFFQQIARAAEKTLKLPEGYAIAVIFVRSRQIHVINREYRGIDRPTDVISFAIRDQEEAFDEPDAQEGGDLGDIFLNIDYCRAQARAYGHSLKREAGFLFLHGLLHCLGYDHQTAAQEKEMFGLQDRILDPIVSRK